eukprot:923627-Prymnesium_polylepis.1
MHVDTLCSASREELSCAAPNGAPIQPGLPRRPTRALSVAPDANRRLSSMLSRASSVSLRDASKRPRASSISGSKRPTIKVGLQGRPNGTNNQVLADLTDLCERMAFVIPAAR